MNPPSPTEALSDEISSAGTRPLRSLHYLDAVCEEAGGVVRAVLDLCDGLVRAGVEVTLLTGDATDVPPSWRENKPGAPRVIETSRAMTPLMKVAAADGTAVNAAVANADVVHLHTPWDRYNLAVASAARWLGKPYIVSIHGMLDDWSMSQRGLKKRTYLNLVGRRMLEGAAALHFTAEGEREQAMQWAPRANGRVLPLVMDLQPYRHLPGPEIARQTFPQLAGERAKLLFLSRVHPKKGVELLIQAVASLNQQGQAPQQVEALIAGPGEADYVAQLRQLAESLGLERRIHFLGMVRGEAKLSLYQACDLFVLPTSQENFGIVLTEAMACATPIVTTRGVDIWQELEQRGARIVQSDASQVAEAVRVLLADRDALHQRGQQSREQVLKWLDPKTVVAGYVALYEGVCG